jgi:hypothetical protein
MTLKFGSDNYVSLSVMLFSLSIYVSSTVFVYKYFKFPVLWLAAGKSSELHNSLSA